MRCFDISVGTKRLNIDLLVIRMHSHLRVWTLRGLAFHVISEQEVKVGRLLPEAASGGRALGSHSHDA